MTLLTRILQAKLYAFGFDFIFFLGGFFGICVSSVARILTSKQGPQPRGTGFHSTRNLDVSVVTALYSATKLVGAYGDSPRQTSESL